MAGFTNNSGFVPSRTGKTQRKRRADAVELITTLALSVSIVIAATAVSLVNRSLTRADLAEHSSAHISAPGVDAGK